VLRWTNEARVAVVQTTQKNLDFLAPRFVQQIPHGLHPFALKFEKKNGPNDREAAMSKNDKRVLVHGRPKQELNTGPTVDYTARVPTFPSIRHVAFRLDHDCLEESFAHSRVQRRAARSAGLDTARAEDVVQSTFTTLIETAPRFEGRSHIRTWLFGILY